MTRDWILRILAELPVWCWPVFLWEVCCWRRWWTGLPDDVAALAVFGATRTGRIVLVGYYEGERAAPQTDWTRRASRAPWKALDVGVIAAALIAVRACGRNQPEDRPVTRRMRFLPTPAYLDSG